MSVQMIELEEVLTTAQTDECLEGWSQNRDNPIAASTHHVKAGWGCVA